MNTNYDIIIIGSGAGGGTLARHLGAFRKANLVIGKRRLAEARKGKLGS